uniref:Uncharacterized protein n=1 Tax=Romanomermis culicivorax TaxID=13658 RepID=A0A915HX07_ROMCU
MSTNTHLIKKRSKRFKTQIERSSLSPFTFPVPGDPHCAQNYLDLLYICDPDVWLGHTDAIRLDQILSTSKFARCQIRGNNLEFNINNKAESISNSGYFSKVAAHRSDFSLENSLYSVGLGLIDALYFNDLDGCRSSFKITQKNESSVENIYIEDDDVGKYKERATARAFLRKAAKIIKKRWNFRKRSSTLTDNAPICAKDVFILMVKTFTICMKNRMVVFRRSPMISVVFAPRVRSVIDEATFVKLINGLAISPSANDPLGSLSENFHSAYNAISRMFFILETSLPGIDRMKNQKLPSDEDQGNNRVQTMSAEHNQTSATFSDDIDELKRRFRSMKYHVPQWAVATFLVTGCLSVVCFSIGHFISTGLRSKNRFSNPDKKSLFYKTGHRRWRAGFAVCRQNE